MSSEEFSSKVMLLWSSWGDESSKGHWRGWFEGFFEEESAPSGRVLMDKDGVTIYREGRETFCWLWEEPHGITLNWWPYECGLTGELTLKVYVKNRARKIALKTVWPRAGLTREPQLKREQGMYLNPSEWLGLFEKISLVCALNGEASPSEVEIGISPGLLEGLKSVESGESCADCGSDSLEWLGAAAYRCASCDYEGGKGWGLFLETRRRSELAFERDDERAARVKDYLKAAREMLHSTTRRGGGERRSRRLRRAAKSLIEVSGRWEKGREVLEEDVKRLCSNRNWSKAEVMSLSRRLETLLSEVPKRLPAPER